MSEAVSRTPLTYNQQLGQHLDLEFQDYQARPDEHFDPRSPQYDQDALLHTASYDYLGDRIQDKDESAFISVNQETGQNELSTERLEADADLLGSWVQDDLSALKKAVRDPKQTRKQMYELNGTTVSGGEIPDSKLSLDEVYGFINGRIRLTENNHDSPVDEALHSVSLTLVRNLVKTWERQQHEAISQGQQPEGVFGEQVELLKPAVAGQTTLDVHLSKNRETVQTRFHEVHRQRIRNLGGAVVAARTTGNMETAPADDVEAARRLVASLNISSERSSQRPAGQEVTAQEEAVPEASRQIPENQSTPERAESENPLVDKLVKAGSGQTYIDAGIRTAGFSPLGDGPSPKENGNIANLPSRIYQEVGKGSRDWRDRPCETVAFTELSDKPGTVRFRYSFSTQSDILVRLGIRVDQLPAYPVQDGSRSGQRLNIGVDLPKALADELEATTKPIPSPENPNEETVDLTVVRSAVAKLFINNNGFELQTDNASKPGGNPKADAGTRNWDGDGEDLPICPPYAKLPKGWRVTIVKGKETSKGSAGQSDLRDMVFKQQSVVA